MEFLKGCHLDIRPNIYWWYRGEVISPAIEVRLLDSTGSVLQCEESLEIRVSLALADDLMDTMSLNSKGQRALFGTRTKRMKDFTAKFDDLALNVDMGDDRLEGLMFVASASGDFNGVYVSPHPFVSATLAAPPFSCPICSNPKEAHPTARDCICDDCAKIILTPLRSPDEDIGSSRRASKATKDQQAGSKDSTGTPLRVELEDRRKSKAMEAATERPRSEGTSGEPSGGPATPSKAREENPKRPRLTLEHHSKPNWQLKSRRICRSPRRLADQPIMFPGTGVRSRRLRRTSRRSKEQAGKKGYSSDTRLQQHKRTESHWRLGTWKKALGTANHASQQGIR
mmetsp:Transcript_26931/g.104544  ORF Transcript_26931/g.104544 Transcript_26931/m.104544 type:complete len:341 (+) Transcript_26931:327-1349(+)